MTAGTLVDIGQHRLGAFATYRYFRCLGCDTDFPMIDGAIRCNGDAITRCPYCTDPVTDRQKADALAWRGWTVTRAAVGFVATRNTKGLNP